MVNEVSDGATFATRVSVVAGAARTKRVSVPLLSEPVLMGVHGDVAAHYGFPDGSYEPHPTTLDYFVGAVVACLCGTFGGLLSHLGQPVADGRLRADGSGELVTAHGTLRLNSIHVQYRLEVATGIDPADVRRAHERHQSLCPISRSIDGGIAVATDLALA
jgi:uncharacterized OsmC-like protein